MEKEYPRYTREQNKAIKLLDKDIKEIKELYAQGYPISYIAKKFNVAKSTPRRYLFPEEAKLLDKKRSEWQKVNKDTARTYKNYRKFLVRKKELLPKYRQWIAEINKEQKKRNPFKTKLYYQKWYQKYGARYYGLKRGYKKYLAMKSANK